MADIAADSRLVRALFREPVDTTPIWIMRQAGRYLPEYREVRSRAGSFMNLCTNPELACEVTLQPLRRFDLDAAILFSDILTIPDAMGLGLSVIENEGPRFERPVRAAADVGRLGIPDPEAELRYVMDAVRLIRGALKPDTPLIGFAGSPWTLATYMVEGGPSKEFSIIKGMLYRDPALLHELLDILARAVTEYLNAQIAAGVDVVMLFDTWGGVLRGDTYADFSLAYMQRVVRALARRPRGRRIPVILFSKGAGQWIERIAESGCDAVGVDWTTDIGAARRRIGSTVALQGNLDPAVLYADDDVIRREVELILEAFGPGTGHVFNLGHGIQPAVDPDRVATLVSAVHELARPFHESR